jgi:mannose-6-phosphate isomerase
MQHEALTHPLYLLHGCVQHYPWGGYHFIPSLLGVENPENRPFAELWMGTHAQGPSAVERGQLSIGLDELIAAEADKILGKATSARFGSRLPFLFKILDARDMLSIQVHPSRLQAAAGFAEEEAAGIPLDAPQRNYKDDNHKPEVHVALSRFWMLHGFRPLDEIADMLVSIPDFADLAPWFPIYLLDVDEDSAGGQELLRRLYEQIMTMPQSEVDRILKNLLARIEPLFDRGALNKISPHYWAVKAARSFPLPGDSCDRGIFSIYMMNLIELLPGEGTFQGAGIPHAYLEGTNVELMANSDNVLRGGLTPKHIDVPELLKTVNFASGKPEILTGTAISPSEQLYRTPTEDFELSRIELMAGGEHRGGMQHGPDILILLEGSALLSAAGQNQRLLQRGDIILAAADSAWTLQSASGAQLYRATVPLI